MSDKSVTGVGQAGFRWLSVVRLNVAKMVILTSEAQPPNTLLTRDGPILKVVERNQWSMVNACTPQGEPILGTGGEKKNKNWIMYIGFACDLSYIWQKA